MAKQKKAVSKGRDIEIHEKIEIAEQVCEMYASDQYTLSACLSQFGIESDSTWYKWCQEIEEIEELYNKGKISKRETYREKLKQRARTTLERYLDGFTIDIVEQEATLQTGQNRKQEMVVTKIKNKQIYVRPSVTAAIKILYNVDGENFTPNPEPYKSGNEKMPHKLEIEIKGDDTPPVTSEEDIEDIIE